MCTLLRAAESGHISHYFKSLIRIQVFIQVHISPWSLARPAGMPPRAPGRGMSRGCARAYAWCDWSPTGRSLKPCGCLPWNLASVHCDSAPRAWGSGERARCVEQHQQHGLCNSRLCRPHLRPPSIAHSLRLCHSDRHRGPRAWWSGGCALCVSQQQQHPNLHGPRDLLVLPT